MRASRTYGSVRGARHETRVPTATPRREFITLLGGAAVAWPVAARAQQPTMPVIGFLSARSREESAHLVASFQRGLAEQGPVEGQNIAIEYRWADGHYDRLPEQAAEFVRRPVAVLVAVGGDMTARAAISATRTIPIVAVFIGDPVANGLVVSLSRPGGNVTGVSNLNAVIEIQAPWPAAGTGPAGRYGGCAAEPRQPNCRDPTKRP